MLIDYQELSLWMIIKFRSISLIQNTFNKDKGT